jgi:hypothetical protein
MLSLFWVVSSIVFSTSYEVLSIAVCDLSNLAKKIAASAPSPTPYRFPQATETPPPFGSVMGLSFGFFEAQTASLRQSRQPTRLFTIVSGLPAPRHRLSLNLLVFTC